MKAIEIAELYNELMKLDKDQLIGAVALLFLREKQLKESLADLQTEFDIYTDVLAEKDIIYFKK